MRKLVRAAICQREGVHALARSPDDRGHRRDGAGTRARRLRELTYRSRQRAADRISESAVVSKLVGAIDSVRRKAMQPDDLVVSIGHGFGARSASSRATRSSSPRQRPRCWTATTGSGIRASYGGSGPSSRASTGGGSTGARWGGKSPLHSARRRRCAARGVAWPRGPASRRERRVRRARRSPAAVAPPPRAAPAAPSGPRPPGGGSRASASTRCAASAPGRRAAGGCPSRWPRR